MDRAPLRTAGARALAALLFAAAAAVGVAAGPPAARAAPDAGAEVRARLGRGRALYEEQEYRKAIRELEPVQRDPAATRAQKLQALELVGLCAFIIGDERRAREAFEDLLSIDAGYELREASGSPKIRQFFERVKRGFVPGYHGAPALLEHAAPTGAVAGRSVELAAEATTGADLVKEVAVLWRRRGVLEYRQTIMAPRGAHRYRVRFTPPADRAGYVLEYYLEGRDLAGNPVARVGGPEVPLALPLGGAAPVDRPWYRRWYVWAGAGAALGAVVAGTLAASADRAPEGTLPPGTVDLGR